MNAPKTPLNPPLIQGGEHAGIAIHHVDPALLVCDKPPGWLAVPGRGEAGHDCLLARLQAHWPDADVVHRLDMATSGLMVFARGKAAQRALSMAFAARQVSKRYVALVHGMVLAQGWHEITLPLSADWPNRPRQKIDADHGKPSLTRYRVMGHEEGSTRLELEPVTGRSHQLRVHLLSIGHPILGDGLYAPAAVAEAASRLMLHAESLAFKHPDSGVALSFHSRPAF